MIQAILAFLNPLKPILKELSSAYALRLDAKTEKERIHAEERVRNLEIQKDLAIAAAKHDCWYSPRKLVEYSVAAFIIKIVLLDTVLKWGTTPDPGQLVTYISITVLGFWFGSASVNRITDVIASAIAKKNSK